MMNKGLVDYLKTHDKCECGDLCITKTKYGYTVSIAVDDLFRDGILDAYEGLTGKQMRICSVCGNLMDSGYVHPEGGFYACNDECFEKDCNERYGKGKWKCVDDMTEEDWEHADELGFCEGVYWAYLDNDGIWQPDETIWTMW